MVLVQIPMCNEKEVNYNCNYYKQQWLNWFFCCYVDVINDVFFVVFMFF
jgi:hypothetical protein